MSYLGTKPANQVIDSALIGNGSITLAKLSADAKFASGTSVLFQQSVAPTGWTKSTAHDNKALRVVSGTAGSGGSVAFTTAFASKAVSGTVGNTTLTESQMPSHTHQHGGGQNGDYVGLGGAGGQGGWGFANNINNNIYRSFNYNTGGSQAHNHSFTGTAIDMAVQYVDVIIATKD